MNLGEVVHVDHNISGREGALKFMLAFMSAPSDADIAFYVSNGSDLDTGEPVKMIKVVVEHPSIQRAMVILTAGQARELADGAEDTMRAFPSTREARDLSSLIMGLRVAADKLEEMADE